VFCETIFTNKTAAVYFRVNHMNAVVRRFVLPLSAALLLATAAYVLLGIMGELILGNWEVGRLFPFSNAHLREEASEGLYAPLSDPLFVLFSVLVAICSFGPSMFWGALRAAKSELWFVWLAALIGVGLVAFTLGPELSSETPSSISTAALFSIAVCFGASGAGIWFATLVGPVTRGAAHG
jgi:hypothetical protein